MFVTFMLVLFMVGVWKCHLDTFQGSFSFGSLCKGLTFRESNKWDIHKPISTKTDFRGYRLAQFLTLYPRNFVFVDLASSSDNR